MTQVRDWVETDYYADLGVSDAASEEEIGRAYRALAKQLHPDQSRSESASAAEFSRIAVAYGILSDPQLRSDYDRVNRQAGTGVRIRPQNPMGTVPSPPATPMVRWTPAKASAAIVFGAVFVVAGFATATVTTRLHLRDSSVNRERIAVIATVIQTTSGSQQLSFEDVDGRNVVAPIPERLNPGVMGLGETLGVLYRPSDPTDLVANESHFARNFTLWIIVVKFFVGGPVVMAIGLRRHRQFQRIRTRA